jgi:hypothetical protein
VIDTFLIFFTIVALSSLLFNKSVKPSTDIKPLRPNKKSKSNIKVSLKTTYLYGNYISFKDTAKLIVVTKNKNIPPIDKHFPRGVSGKCSVYYNETEKTWISQWYLYFNTKRDDLFVKGILNKYKVKGDVICYGI